MSKPLDCRDDTQKYRYIQTDRPTGRQTHRQTLTMYTVVFSRSNINNSVFLLKFCITSVMKITDCKNLSPTHCRETQSFNIVPTALGLSLGVLYVVRVGQRVASGLYPYSCPGALSPELPPRPPPADGGWNRLGKVMLEYFVQIICVDKRVTYSLHPLFDHCAWPLARIALLTAQVL